MPLLNLRLGPWRFAPGVVPSAGAVLLIAITIALGNWQMRRAATKSEIRDHLQAYERSAPMRIGSTPIAAGELEWHTVDVRGTYDAARTILLDNRVLDGRVGYQVVTPLRIEGGTRYVLINRGWIAAGPTRMDLPAVVTPDRVQSITGLAVVPPTRVFELGETAPDSRVWQHLILERYARWSGFSLQPVIVQQTSPAADGLERRWERPDLGVEKHLAYALQWYAFATLTLILYVALNLKRETGNPAEPPADPKPRAH